MTRSAFASVLIRVIAFFIFVGVLLSLLDTVVEVCLQGYLHDVDIASLITIPISIVLLLFLFFKSDALGKFLCGKGEAASNK
jgi:hypothetical protein